MPAHESLQRLLDTAIFDANGVRSGRLSDVLVDPRDGRIEYVQIALEPAGSGGWRYVVVPWSTIGVDRTPVAAEKPEDERWFVKVRRETLERLARFETGTAGGKP